MTNRQAALRKAKWVDGVTAEDRVSQVARQAIAARLGLVAYYLPRAAEQYDENLEYVHQLRVATRRSVAALDRFAGLLPKKQTVWLRKQLRKVRRAAGEARDLDVLIERFTGECESEQKNAATFLLAEASQQRAKVQEPILRVCKRLRKQRFDRRIERLLKKIRWRSDGDEPTLGRTGPEILRPIGARFFAASREGPKDEQALHRLRIRGKQLRYSIELLARAFDPALRKEIYPRVEQLQQRLGTINDHAAARDRFQRWHDRREPAAGAEELLDLIAHERSALAEAVAEFRLGWTDETARQLEADLEQVIQKAERSAGAG